MKIVHWFCIFATLLFLSAVAQNAVAQLAVTSNTTYVIDFDNTVTGVNNSTYQGFGFQPNPPAGLLDSNAWAVTGWSDGSVSFGGTSVSPPANDFARGEAHAAIVSGGMYAFSGGNITTGVALGIQPGQGDWAPGTLTLKVRNSTGQTLTGFNLAYTVYVRNDQPRGSNFDFSYSLDNSSYNSVADLHLASPTTADTLGFVSNGLGKTLSGLSIPDNSFVYLRWSGSDVGGTGTARDEFALDNITLNSFTFSGVAPQVGDVDQNGVVSVADVQALMTALVDLPAYASVHPALNPSQVSLVLDVNHDNQVNSADIQSLIVGLASGILGNHPQVVPEPAAFQLSLLGAVVGLLLTNCGRKISSQPSRLNR